MSEPKTKATTQNPKEFLSTIEPEEKRLDSLVLLQLFEKVTSEKAVMWGTAIIGFGSYHSNTGEWPLTGFSPRKQNLTLYVLAGNKEQSELLKKLGKHKARGGCLYLNKLSDVDQTVLSKLIETSFQFTKKKNT